MPRKVFFTADPHFGHANIVTYCDRPFRKPDGQPDVRAMGHGMVERWNAVVGKDDLVYVLGDFGWGPAAYQAGWLALLNGRKVLVRGNHDKLTVTSYLKMGFERVEKTVDAGLLLMRHYPPLQPMPQYEVILCGHVHERWAERVGPQVGSVRQRIINVGVDVRGFRPVTLEELGVGPGLLPPRLR